MSSSYAKTALRAQGEVIMDKIGTQFHELYSMMESIKQDRLEGLSGNLYFDTHFRLANLNSAVIFEFCNFESKCREIMHEHQQLAES